MACDSNRFLDREKITTKTFTFGNGDTNRAQSLLSGEKRKEIERNVCGKPRGVITWIFVLGFVLRLLRGYFWSMRSQNKWILSDECIFLGGGAAAAWNDDVFVCRCGNIA